jgi:hypothetical protein
MSMRAEATGCPNRTEMPCFDPSGVSPIADDGIRWLNVTVDDDMSPVVDERHSATELRSAQV